MRFFPTSERWLRPNLWYECNVQDAHCGKKSSKEDSEGRQANCICRQRFNREVYTKQWLSKEVRLLKVQGRLWYFPSYYAKIYLEFQQQVIRNEELCKIHPLCKVRNEGCQAYLWLRQYAQGRPNFANCLLIHHPPRESFFTVR